MHWVTFAIICCFCGASVQQDEEFYYGFFPDDFLWGLATSSYQIEGGWDAPGKGENIWDRFAHTPGKIDDNSTGDVACDSFNRYEQDVEALKNIGADFYRFSISWARIMPDGTTRNVSQEGIDYYNRLINALIREGIIPMVSLFHWELPQALHDAGSWPSQTIASHFGDYARICFREFGDRVKHWITFNEPGTFCQLGYAYGSHAPGIQSPAEMGYKCVHTVLMSHGYAYRIYDQEFRSQQRGALGMALGIAWYPPSDPADPDDQEASERALQFNHGWFTYPLMYGEYPPVMRRLIDEKSSAEGLDYSRLPHFDPFWTQMINGTLDFHGMNYYTSDYVRASIRNDPGHDGDQNVDKYRDPAWPCSAASWLCSCPWCFRRILTWIDRTYDTVPVKKPIYVFENGWADHEYESTNDTARINYFNLHINEMLKAIRLDDANVKGYTAWSLMDNFEWAAGYTERFGIHWINWTDPNLTRVPKDSAYFLKQLFEDNGFPEPVNRTKFGA